MAGDIFSSMTTDELEESKIDYKDRFRRVNVLGNLKKCRYTGDCKWKYDTHKQKALCNICIYKTRFNIPELIDAALEDKDKKMT